MNENRGAKGSIKDRLISLLYRLRYRKKVLKQENYTIENKTKQENYLYDLKYFEEKENIDILDLKDKAELDKVKFTVNFKMNSKKGIDNIDLELYSIETKSSELDEKVDLKKEIRKTKDEIVILKEVDTFIKKSIENISDIEYELKIIKRESKEKNKDTKELEERYNRLKEKVTKLKLQYDAIKEKYDLSEFSILESIKLIDTIDDYKSVVKLNEMEMMLKVCKKEISKIDSITVIVEENKNVGSNIEETKEEQKQVKIKFNKSKSKINELSSLEEDLNNEIKYQQQVVDEMYEKASFFEKEVSKKIEIIGKRDILGSVLRIAGGILTLPFTGKQLFGISLGSTLINKALKEMNRSLETKEKIVVNYRYEDISKQIEQVKDKVEYTNLILSDSLIEIKKLKGNFKNTYSEYDNILPEYNSMLEKLETLESKILKQQEKLLKMDKKLDKEKEVNKQKLKRIER